MGQICLLILEHKNPSLLKANKRWAVDDPGKHKHRLGALSTGQLDPHMTATREGLHLKTTFHNWRKERLTGGEKARGSQRKGWKKGNWVMAFGKLSKHMLTQYRIKGGLCCVQRPSHRSSSPSLLAWDSMDIPPESHRPSMKQQWESSHLHWQTRLAQETLQSAPSCFAVFQCRLGSVLVTVLATVRPLYWSWPSERGRTFVGTDVCQAGWS